MGSIEPYETTSGRRYKVQFRKPDRSTTTKRGFPTKRAAQLFLAQAELHIAGGTCAALLQVECRGKLPGELVFGAGFDYLSTPTHKDGWFAGARRRSVLADSTFPPKLTIHDLRHTAASLAISAGANVKAVQRMLGHASAAMTLDTYADLFEDDLDAVASALDHARTSSVAVKTQSRAGVSSPDDPREARKYRAERGAKDGAPGGSRTPNRFLRTELLFH